MDCDIVILSPEGNSSTVLRLKKEINNFNKSCNILKLCDENILFDGDFKLNCNLIHPRCSIGWYLDKITTFSWQILNILKEDNVLVNSLETIYNSSDKFKTIHLLNRYGITTPRTGLIRDYDDAVKFMEKYNLNFPVILKKSFSKCGLSVVKVSSNNELKKYSENGLWEGTLIQEYLDFKDNSGKYKDIRVLVVDGEVVGGYSRISNNFITNLHKSNNIVEVININDEIKEISIKCAEIMKGNILAVDILPFNDNYYVIETNASPGTDGFLKIGNKSVDKIIAKCLINHIKK